MNHERAVITKNAYCWKLKTMNIVINAKRTRGIKGMPSIKSLCMTLRLTGIAKSMIFLAFFDESDIISPLFNKAHKFGYGGKA